MPPLYDIVVFGATGFSGRLLSEHLIKEYGDTAKLALAGRNMKKVLKFKYHTFTFVSLRITNNERCLGEISSC